ncbi:MAG: hypothetical protein WDO73_31455 [Ignavibacteriota bacterium]
MRAWLHIFNTWNPDFHIDNHVSDGSDMQYDVTWDMARNQDIAEPARTWFNRAFHSRTRQAHGRRRSSGSPVRRPARSAERPRVLHGSVLAAPTRTYTPQCRIDRRCWWRLIA